MLVFNSTTNFLFNFLKLIKMHVLSDFNPCLQFPHNPPNYDHIGPLQGPQGGPPIKAIYIHPAVAGCHHRDKQHTTPKGLNMNRENANTPANPKGVEYE